MNKRVIIHDLGIIKYKQAVEYQEKLFLETLEVKSSNKKNNDNIATKNHLIFCEHPHVYTIGKSGEASNLLARPDFLKQIGADFFKRNRCGDITYHGPGQIVVYPIIDLDNFYTDINKYLRQLEEAVIQTLKCYGVNAKRSKGETGVWIDVGTKRARKICALGVKTSRCVTMHGLAFNVSADLSYFNHIVPCGIPDKDVTSLELELDKRVNIDEVKKILKEKLLETFEMKIETQ